MQCVSGLIFMNPLQYNGVTLEDLTQGASNFLCPQNRDCFIAQYSEDSDQKQNKNLQIREHGA